MLSSLSTSNLSSCMTSVMAASLSLFALAYWPCSFIFIRPASLLPLFFTHLLTLCAIPTLILNPILIPNLTPTLILITLQSLLSSFLFGSLLLLLCHNFVHIFFQPSLKIYIPRLFSRSQWIYNPEASALKHTTALFSTFHGYIVLN